MPESSQQGEEEKRKQKLKLQDVSEQRSAPITRDSGRAFEDLFI